MISALRDPYRFSFGFRRNNPFQSTPSDSSARPGSGSPLGNFEDEIWLFFEVMRRLYSSTTSLGFPNATVLPRFSKIAWSQYVLMRSKLWVTKRIVVPFSLNFWNLEKHFA